LVFIVDVSDFITYLRGVRDTTKCDMIADISDVRECYNLRYSTFLAVTVTSDIAFCSL